MPQVDEMCQRSARGILSGLAIAAVECYIDIHRQVINGATSLGYLLNIFGISPRLENLLCITVVTKHLRPGGCRFRAIGL